MGKFWGARLRVQARHPSAPQAFHACVFWGAFSLPLVPTFLPWTPASTWYVSSFRDDLQNISQLVCSDTDQAKQRPAAVLGQGLGGPCLGIMGQLGPLGGKEVLKMGSGQQKQKLDTVGQVRGPSGQHVFTPLDLFAEMLTSCSDILRHTRQYSSNISHSVCLCLLCQLVDPRGQRQCDSHSFAYPQHTGHLNTVG